MLAARQAELCEKAAAALRAEGAMAQAISLDLCDGASVEQAAKAAEAIGPIDVLVSNAGLSRPWYATSTDPATLREIFETNLVGVQPLTAHHRRVKVPSAQAQS